MYVFFISGQWSMEFVEGGERSSKVFISKSISWLENIGAFHVFRKELFEISWRISWFHFRKVLSTIRIFCRWKFEIWQKLKIPEKNWSKASEIFWDWCRNGIKSINKNCSKSMAISPNLSKARLFKLQSHGTMSLFRLRIVWNTKLRYIVVKKEINTWTLFFFRPFFVLRRGLFYEELFLR